MPFLSYSQIKKIWVLAREQGMNDKKLHARIKSICSYSVY
ncbi:hypothetical protein FACS189490_13880 [Clostridia bacterium]|nr:hypothetical protein FACS189490_13880 [Clostridia bacterium]